MRRRLTVIVALFLAICELGCHQRYVEVAVASRVQLGSRWITITPDHMLTWSEPNEELSLHIDSPHTFDSSAGLIMTDGRHCSIDVDIVSADGSVYSTDWHGILNGDMFFGLSQKPSALEAIKAFRVKSSFPLTVSNLVWRGYDPREVKR